MQKVITINLNGNAYQIDDGGYAALVAYLEGAERQLADNPDRAEIVADLEQAIADKCRGFLNPHKTVVTAGEVDQIIREMGPVEAADTRPGGAGAQDGDAGQQRSGRTGPRRLYRIPEDGVWMGVCSGLAAYMGIDVVFVRIAFLILIAVSFGWGIVGYWILARVIPEAYTSEERAAAHGQPFNAQELIDRAKTNYSDFTGNRREWRRAQREARRRWRQNMRDWRWSRWSHWGGVPYVPSPVAYGPRMFGGLMMPVLTLLSIGLFWLWLFSIFSLVTRQEVFGQALPDDMPLWLGIVILVVVYQAVAWPLHMMRRSSYHALGGGYHGTVAAFDGILGLAFAGFGIWLAYHYVPEVREFLQQVPDIIRSVTDSVRT